MRSPARDSYNNDGPCDSSNEILPTGYRLADEALLSKVPIPKENIHRMRGEIEPNDAAKEYGQLLKDQFGDGGLDLVLLGMGDDGHTASLFPYSEALKEPRHRCVAHFVE